MTDLEQRYTGAPRRTSALPMAFSAGEFIRGALLAWLVFMLLAPIMFMVAVAIIGAPASVGDFLFSAVFIALMGAFTILPWAVGALAIGSPLAFLLGRSLRRTGRISVHLLLFTAFGLLLGLVSAAVAVPVIDAADVDTGGYWEGVLAVLHFVVGAVLASTIAVPLGWWITARLALRADARRNAVAPVATWEHPAA